MGWPISPAFTHSQKTYCLSTQLDCRLSREFKSRISVKAFQSAATVKKSPVELSSKQSMVGRVEHSSHRLDGEFICTSGLARKLT